MRGDVTRLGGQVHGVSPGTLTGSELMPWGIGNPRDDSLLSKGVADHSATTQDRCARPPRRHHAHSHRAQREQRPCSWATQQPCG